jgi:putative phage-type endonuclease
MVQGNNRRGPEQLPEEFGLHRSLEFYPIETHTDEWFKFREERGFGGSEIGYLAGLSPYKSPLNVYYEKLGMTDDFTDDNEAMFNGRQAEPYVRKLWTHYDGTKEGYIEHFKNDNVIRRCGVVEGYIVNPKYPFLFASIDGLILPGQHSLVTGEIMEKPGILEIKTINSMYANKWESGIPPQYLAQVMQYMIVLELDYSEIALQRDGRWFSVEPIPRNEALCKKIIDTAKDFWENKILPAKALQEKMKTSNKRDSELLLEEIHSMEPDPDASDAYKEFMAKRFLFDPIEKDGSKEDYKEVIRFKFWNEVINLAKGEKQLCENKLRHSLFHNKADKFIFSEKDWAKVAMRKGSDKLTFTCKTTFEYDQDKIKEQLKNLEI